MKLLILTVLLFSSACAGVSTIDTQLMGGTYTSSENATITLDAQSAILENEDGRFEYVLTDVPTKLWPQGCRTGGVFGGGSISRMETKKIDENRYLVPRCPAGRVVYVTTLEDLTCRTKSCEKYYAEGQEPTPRSKDSP